MLTTNRLRWNNNPIAIGIGLIILLFIFTLCGCSSSDDIPGDPGGQSNGNGNATVSGTVKDIDGNPYERVKIDLKQAVNQVGSTTTDETGRFAFNNVKSGDYSLLMNLPLASDEVSQNPADLTVNGSNTASVDFVIETDEVDGNVTLGANDPLGEVRTEDGSVPSNADDLLYAVNVFSNFDRVPILNPDGQHIKRSEWDDAQGTMNVYCNGDTSYFEFEFSGLIPNGAYTLWVGPVNGLNILGTGALGNSSGTDNILDVDASGNAEISLSMEAGNLSVFGMLSSCILTNGTDIMIILDYHIDNQTHGPSPGPDHTEVGHILFVL